MSGTSVLYSTNLIVSRQAGKLGEFGPRGEKAGIAVLDVAEWIGVVQIIDQALPSSS